MRSIEALPADGTVVEFVWFDDTGIQSRIYAEVKDGCVEKMTELSPVTVERPDRRPPDAWRYPLTAEDIIRNAVG